MRLLFVLILLLGCSSHSDQTVVLQKTPPPKPVAATTATPVPQSAVAQSNTTRTPSNQDLNSAGCVIPPQPKKFVKPPQVPKGITGRVGLFVGRFSRGTKEFKLEQATWQNPQGQFPLASNFKTSVLFEVMRGIDAGTIKTTERFSVTKANQSYGRYPYDNTLLLDLAMAMISWSDNTATDILFRRVGLDGLQPTAQRLKLCNTRLLLPTKTWWTAQAGLGGADFPKYSLVASSKRFANAPYATQLALAERLDQKAMSISAETLRRYLDQGYFAGRNGGVETMSQIDRNLQNASTPHEWARFMWNAFVSLDLSSQSQQRFRKIMYHGKGRSYLRVPFKYYGGKSGNTARILTYSGFLETLSGDKVIYVYMNDSSQNLITRDETDLVFSYINAALKKVIRPADLVLPKPKPTAAKKP
ncbi:MAG: serine hydrolase [Deinococcales bacterium]